MAKELSPEKRRRADELAVKILDHSRNMLIMELRFMEQAAGLLRPVPYDGTMMTDGRNLYFDSRWILTEFQSSDRNIVRSYLHSVLHCVFKHFLVSPSVEHRYWDLACDIAAEVMLEELGFSDPETRRAALQTMEISKFRKELKYLTAEKIYEHLRETTPHENRISALENLFREDSHEIWYVRPKKKKRTSSDKSGAEGEEDTETIDNDVNISEEEIEGESDREESGEQSSIADQMRTNDDRTDEDIEQQWTNISRRMQTDLETFSQKHGSSAGSLVQNLQAVNRERYDYSEFLRKFAVYGEEMKTDEDSFDYNFYCYGLEQYGNAAIIEPLEYSDVKRVREFVIAIDTSGSVQGRTVQMFLQKTFNILKQQENFFSKVNIHIIQCDAAVQEDAKITSTEEFEQYLKTIELRGFGGTDFRPVFRYVNKMVENREFEDLRGLIYFTDGYGTFPEKQPSYNTAFVFLDDEYNNYNVPVWAMKLILETNDIVSE